MLNMEEVARVFASRFGVRLRETMVDGERKILATMPHFGARVYPANMPEHEVILAFLRERFEREVRYA